MKTHTFTDWLYSEVMSARNALLTLYEQMDKMKFIEGPQLEQQYMDLVGSEEETIIPLEIKCELLKKKQQLIQAAINRREPVDEAAIDAQINALWEEKLQEAGGTIPPGTGCYSLSQGQLDDLQELYQKIVKSFHPHMHPEITENQKLLFDKAQEAYRRRDMAALQLIYDMLTSTEGETMTMTLTLSFSVAEDDSEAERQSFTTDYTLAKKLYSCFVPTAEEVTIREEQQRCQEKQEQVMEQLEAMKQHFPFNAAQMLADPAQLEDYKRQLALRKYEAEKMIQKLENEIQSMLERVKARG